MRSLVVGLLSLAAMVQTHAEEVAAPVLEQIRPIVLGSIVLEQCTNGGMGLTSAELDQVTRLTDALLQAAALPEDDKAQILQGMQELASRFPRTIEHCMAAKSWLAKAVAPHDVAINLVAPRSNPRANHP